MVQHSINRSIYLRITKIYESQRKIEQTDRLINQWDSLYLPDWADSFGTFED